MEYNKVHTYYAFQHRKIAESKWLTKTPIRKVKNIDDWCFSSWDYFCNAINPLDKSGDKYRYKKGCEEPHDVWSKTGHYGYWNVNAARAALKRLREFDSRGEFDYKGPYGEHSQSVRHEFRIVQVTTFTNIVPI